MKYLFTLTIIILSVLEVKAGWYECYNYKGFIDKYPITLSIQIKKGYFGAEKQDLNVIGTYKYDRENTPIALEGKWNSVNNSLILFELEGKTRTADFNCTFNKSTAEGIWTSRKTKKTYTIKWTFVSELIDTSDNSICNKIEIIQSKSLADKYFVGIYSKKTTNSRAAMTSLKVMNKKTNAVLQVIDFSKLETPVGNVSTIIYDNLVVENNGFYILIDRGKMGAEMSFKFDKKSNTFKIVEE